MTYSNGGLRNYSAVAGMAGYRGCYG